MGMQNLGLVLQACGDLDGARLLFERALAINEQALGPGHPHTGRVRREYARLLLASGNPGPAHAAASAALSASEKELGAQHLWTQDYAGITADALAALGRGEEAAAVRMHYGVAPN